MSLADQIYEGNSQDTHPLDLGYEDELGLEVFDNAEYLIARAIAVARRDRTSEFTVNQPHMRGDIIYYGSFPLSETEANLHKLTEYDGRVPIARRALFWKKIKKHLPRLDTSIYQISPNLFWDKDSGNVIRKEEIYEKYHQTKA